MISRILLADDSITIQKVVNLTFADEGIEVVAVSNGEMAARRMDEVNPDLVLADIFMPGKNGYELCEAIKTNSKFGNVPVVLLVGAFEPFDQLEARRVRADAHLIKPFESRTLVETVRKLLANTARPRSATLTRISTAQTEPPVEEHHNLITAVPADTIQFESASGEWTEADIPTTETRGPQPLAETMPLDLGSAMGASPTFNSSGIQASAENAEQRAQSWERPTGELVSPPALGEPAANVGSSEYPGVIADGKETELSFEAQTASAGEHAELPALKLETQVWTATEGPLTDRFDQQQMVVDFEESLPSAQAEEGDPPMLEGTSRGVDSEPEIEREWRLEEGEHAADELPSANSRGLNTTKLEMPADARSSIEASEARVNAVGSSEAPAEDEISGSFAAGEPSIVATAEPSVVVAEEPRMVVAEERSLFATDEPKVVVAEQPSLLAPEEPTLFAAEQLSLLAPEEPTLFAAEEPLGDVLSDDDPRPLTNASNVPASQFDEPALAEFSLELPPDEGASDAPAPAAESTRATGELVTAELPMAGQRLVESAAAQDFVAHEVFEPVADAPNQSVVEEPKSAAVDGPSGDHDAPVDSVNYDWTSPGAVIHSTGRLDSTMMPVEFEESSRKALVNEADTFQAAAAEEVADQPVSWESEPLRFAAIDIEASAVGSLDSSANHLSSSQAETGFEISHPVSEVQEPANNENGHHESSDITLPPVELSPTLIDEIVRRVVSQIGDSVVREIAWEVVPDCVERIIGQQTREALAKR
ncbi:MAG TPA: response regulator [Blastocatellia bacterium]|nr:response regulator [Blastocatellia bacterium]